MIRAAFLGTPQAAVPALETLASLTDLRIVITRPDRRRGRGRSLARSPVKARALELGLAVHQPANSEELDSVIASSDLDVAVLVAYGMLIPGPTLERPSAGMLNLHFSLLPRWRGASPVERAILTGDPTTGVTLMQMSEGFDTGGLLAAWGTAIGADETAGELTERLARGGAELLEQSLESVVSGRLKPVPQDDDRVTQAPRLSKQEARLDFAWPGDQLVRAIRAFSPRPGAFTTWRNRRFKIHGARVVAGSLAPGLLEVDGAMVRAGTGRGCIELLSVQPAGARSMAAHEWLAGVRGHPGRFE